MSKQEIDKVGGMGTKPATMIDVAREAGVSLKTVSRVLNEEAHVREKTRKAVVEAAKRLNYQLNQAARALRSGSPKIVSLLVNNPSRSYLDGVHLGALKQCQKQGLQLVLDQCEDGIDGVRRILDSVSPVGIILTPPLCDDQTVLKLLRERNVPYVLIAPRSAMQGPLSVSIDDEAAAREMTEYLISLGHTRIAFIKGHPDHSAAIKRFDGYCAALKAAGLAVDTALVRQGYFDYPSGLHCAESLLDLPDCPTAVFASNDDMAASVLSAAYRRNIHVPNDLSVVGFDNTQIASVISPQLTTVNQPISELASQAISMLTNVMSAIDKERRSVVLEHRLVKRESVGQPRKT